MMAKKNTIDEMSYEDAFAELEAIVLALEQGDASLDKALEQFERGQELAAHCGQLLEQAQLRLTRLSSEGLDGTETD
jgi:exodeoxyribonuclease VII small subunit